MPFPLTMQNFSADLDTAKAYFNKAANESDPAKQQTLALLAVAASQIAQAEAVWITSGPGKLD